MCPSSDQPGTPSAPGRFRFLAFAGASAGCLAVAAWLRFSGLDAKQLWLDENCTFHWAANFFGVDGSGPNPWREPAHVPYYLLLDVWVRLLGETPGVLRGLSALAGCAAVACVACTAFRLGGRRAALITILLATLNPLHVYYSQEARVYAFWTLIIALALHWLTRAAQSSRAAPWIGYGLLAWLAVLTHYYTLLWLPGTAFAAAIANDRRVFWRRWLQIHFVLATALVPPMWLWAVPYMRTGPADWQHAMWQSYPPAFAIFKSLWALLPSGGYPSSYMAPLAASPQAAAAIVGSAVVPCIRWLPAAVAASRLAWFLGRRWLPASRSGAVPGGGEREFEAAQPASAAAALNFGLGLTLSFLVIMWLASLVVGRGYLVARYDLAVWPSMTIALSLLLDQPAASIVGHRADRSTARTVITTLLAACSIATLIGWRSLPIRNDAPERARRIAALIQPGELTVSVGMYRWFMEYEWHRIGFAPRLRSFPAAHDTQLCWRNSGTELADAARITEEATELGDMIDRELSTTNRVWLLVQGDAAEQAWDVDRRLFDELRRRGIDVQPVDDWSGLARLARTSVPR